MVRFVNPGAEVRLAGGREIHLRSLQSLALHIVNSVFLGDYLTSEGQPGAADLSMIADAGFTVEGATPAPEPAAPHAAPPPTSAPATEPATSRAAPAPASAPSAPAATRAPLFPAAPRPDLVHVRRRGPGTSLPANT